MEYWQYLRQKVGSDRVIIPGADAAIVYDERILLVNSIENGNWFLPGGLQELGETIAETAIREVKEELGLELSTDRLISVYSGPKWIRRYRNGDELQSLTFLFRMAVDRDFSDDIAVNPLEVNGWDWFALDDLPDNMNDYSRNMVDDIVGYRGETILR